MGEDKVKRGDVMDRQYICRGDKWYRTFVLSNEKRGDAMTRSKGKSCNVGQRGKDFLGILGSPVWFRGFSVSSGFRYMRPQDVYRVEKYVLARGLTKYGR